MGEVQKWERRVHELERDLELVVRQRAAAEREVQGLRENGATLASDLGVAAQEAQFASEQWAAAQSAQDATSSQLESAMQRTMQLEEQVRVLVEHIQAVQPENSR